MERMEMFIFLSYNRFKEYEPNVRNVRERSYDNEKNA